MASSAVNHPTDEKFKETDVNNKLQLYGIYSAFAQGKAPSNKQIDIALNSALEHNALNKPNAKLSDEGKQLLGDVKDVIEQAKYLFLSKNEGNLLQEFIWETQHITASDTKLPGAPIDKDTAKQHGNEALEGLRTLGTLILSNGQFRKLLKDASILARSIAGDAASKAATKVQPSEDQLAQIDHPADDNTWHEVPDLSKDNLKQQIQKNKPFGKKDLQQAAGDAAETAHPDGSRDLADTAALGAQDQQTGTASGVDAQGGAQSAINTLKNAASENLPEETKQKKETAKNKTSEYNQRTKGYLKNKMPKERREQSIWRLKKMIVEIQGHADYQRAIETLLRLAEEYTGHTKSIANQGQGAVKGAHTDDSLKTAEANLKTLIERFANGTSSDDFFDSLNQIYRDADQDPELKGWFKKLDAYIRRALQEQGYIMQDAATDDWNALYDQGNYLLRTKYRTHTDRILDEIKFFGNQFDEDPQNKAFGQSVQKLFQELGNDEQGNPTFKPHLWKDVTEVILPSVLESVHYIPLPRFEYSDPMADLIVENLIIESDNLAPNVLEFSSDNHWKWGRRNLQSSNKNKVMIAVSGIQMDLRDVSFYVNKKQGFPSISDQGLCDIFMGGEGFSFKIQMETADPSDKTHFFKVDSVNVKLSKSLNIKLKKSKHKILFAIGKPILLHAIKPVLQKAVEQAIKQKATELDAIIYQIHKEATQAKIDAKRNPDPENLQNMYQRYMNAAKQRMTQAQQKKESVQKSLEDKKFNMAMTKQDSIFPNIDLPSGISTKATEYKEFATKGDRWESPVFGIGKAKESTSIPSAPTITRKSHHTAMPGKTDLTNGSSAIGNGSGISNGNGAGYPTNGAVNPSNGFDRQVDRAFDPANA